jgi:hypothetical protein
LSQAGFGSRGLMNSTGASITPHSVIYEFTNLRIGGFGLPIVWSGFLGAADRLVHARGQLWLIEDGEQLVGFREQGRQVRIVTCLGGCDEFQPVDTFVGLLDNVPQFGDKIIMRSTPACSSVVRADSLPARKIWSANSPPSQVFLKPRQKYTTRSAKLNVRFFNASAWTFIPVRAASTVPTEFLRICEPRVFGYAGLASPRMPD